MSQAQKNVDQVFEIIGQRVSHDFPDTEQREGIFFEALKRAHASAQLVRSQEFERGDIVMFTVEIQHADGKKATGRYRARPSAEGLLVMLTNQAQPGDTIRTTTTLVNASIVAENKWPLTLETAEALVPDTTTDECLKKRESTDKLRLRKLGALGKIALETSVGPPLWRIPNVNAEVGRTESGARTASFGAGWRYHAFRFTWVR